MNANAKNKRDLDWLEPFHQKWKQVILFPRTLFCCCHFDTDFILALIYKYIKMF